MLSYASTSCRQHASVLYREVCGLAARENGLAHLSLEDVVGKIAVHMRRDVSELKARDEAIAALVERYVQPSDSDSASDDEVCLVQLAEQAVARRKAEEEAAAATAAKGADVL